MRAFLAIPCFLLLLPALVGGAAIVNDPLAEPPDASVNLMTEDGVRLVQGQWLYHDVRIVDRAFRAPGADGQPSGAQSASNDFEPHAGWADYDDAHWEAIAPESLSVRRGGGKLSFNWYRIRVTVPESVDGMDTSGATIAFETSLDDYAEIWVDGELPRIAGQSGGSVVAGWNRSNRLAIGRDVSPGQTIQIAVFGMNGPISASPTNYIWMRLARLDFYRAGRDASGPRATAPHEVNVDVVRLDPEMDHIVPANPKLFKLAEGFAFIEGPVWSAGRLVFSDPNRNTVYEYDEKGRLSVLVENSGYEGSDVARYRQPGSNGLAIDAQGRLVLAEHGRRRIGRLEADGTRTSLADRYDGKRLNSPNDLVLKSDGAVYFTDPPFGLPGFDEDPGKELSFNGVFRLLGGKLELLAMDLRGPNGIDFSPDERFLYVANWDPERKIVMRYPVRDDGTLATGAVFFDMTGARGEEALDGLEVDAEGHLFVSGPGGIWVLSPDGRHLGTIRTPRLPANFAWGGEDGSSLYLTARTTLYRLPLLVAEARPSRALTSTTTGR